MKFCARPYEHLYIGNNGVTNMCSWLRHPIGNLSEISMEELWNGQKAKEVRESIEDGSFRYCDAISCPLLSNNILPELSEEEFAEKIASFKEKPPVEFNLAYDKVCNHACPTCRDEIFVADNKYKEMVKKIDETLLPYLKHARLIMASGNGDVFASQSMMKLLSSFKPENKACIIKLETNGALVQKNWDFLKNLEEYTIQIVVTPNSYEKESYKYLSGGLDNVEKTMDGLRFLSKLRKENKIQELKVTMVVQDTNFREIPSFIKKSLDEFGVDVVQLRPVMRWFKLSNEGYLQKNVLNPLHPDHEEYLKVMEDPIVQHPQVFHWSGINAKRDAEKLK
jgi:pyruvate-formate lyase-activating enzyme